MFLRFLPVLVLSLGLLSGPSLAGEIWVSNEKDDTLSVIDVETLEVTRTVETGERPRGILFSKDFERLYVCASDSDAVQVIDPDAFAGREALIAEMDHLACEARANPPRPGTDAVRMPGDGAAARRREAKRDGVPLSGRIAEALRSSANDLGVIAPF